MALPGDTPGLSGGTGDDDPTREQLFRSLIDGLPSGVVIQNRSGQIVGCNAAAEQVLGLSLDELRGHTGLDPLWQALREDLSDLPTADQPGMRSLRSGQSVRDVVMAVHTPDGQQRWLQVDAVPLRDQDGELRGVASVFDDITTEWQLSSELAKAEDRLSIIRAASGVGLWEWDLRTGEVRHDDGVTGLLGAPTQDIEEWLDRVHPDDRREARAMVAAIVAGAAPHEMQYRVITADGSERFVLNRPVVVERDEGRPARLAGSMVDTTELNLATERAEHLLDRMTDAYYVVERDWTLVYANPQAEQVLRRPRIEMVGRNIWETFPDVVGTELETQYERAMAGEAVAFEIYYPALDGWYEIRAHPVRDGIAVYFRDITARRAAADEREALLRTTQQTKDQLAHAATHDPLTDLPNRASLVRWLDPRLRAQSPGEQLAVLFVDLDRVKLVNDTHGHAEGDLVLAEAARRLRRLMPEDALVARLGGDEFVVAVTGASARSARTLAETVLEAFHEPFVVGNRRLVLTAGVGISLSDSDTSAPTLLRDADTALYQAKAKGRNQIGVFDDDLREQVVARLHTEADLREGLAAHQLFAHYQPIFDAATGRPVGAEVLARWDHPERAMVQPDEFIPIAEESGLILPLGEFMLDRVIEDREALDRSLGVPATTVWVNVSARELEEPGFAEQLLDRVDHSGLRGRFGIEVTERVLATDTLRSEEALQEIAAAGVQIAIDDFGTGYSSFARLGRFPVHRIKIDRSFVTELSSESGRPLVTAIIELAHAIGADACAEGVEDEEQLAALRELGVDTVSGFHLSRPAAPDRVAPADIGTK